MFLNLSNHPISTWSYNQISAAKALGFGIPQDLPEGMPLVDPEASELQVMDLASKLAKRAVEELGARGAMVMGEFTLTQALILALQNKGISCFATTSKRDVVVADDGSVTKKAVFKFVRFRKYLSPAAFSSSPHEPRCSECGDTGVLPGPGSTLCFYCGDDD